MTQIVKFQKTPNQDHYNNFKKVSNPYIFQNPNRYNVNDFDYQENILRKPFTNRQNNQSQIKLLSDRKISKNLFVNENRVGFMKIDDPLCVRDNCLDKRFNDDHACSSLSAWEQFYLRESVFEGSSQTNFAAANYDEYDDVFKLGNGPVMISSKTFNFSSSTLRIFIPMFVISSISVVSNMKFISINVFGLFFNTDRYILFAVVVEIFDNFSIFFDQISASKKRSADDDYDNYKRSIPQSQTSTISQ